MYFIEPSIYKTFSFQHVIHVKMVNETFILFFHKSSKPAVYFAMIAYLNLGAKFLPEILDLYLDLIKCIAKKVDSHFQVARRILRSIPGVELSISL